MDVLSNIELELEVMLMGNYTADYEPGWKTIEGTHVLFGQEGQIVHGPKALKQWFAPENNQKRHASASGRLEHAKKQLESGQGDRKALEKKIASLEKQVDDLVKKMKPKKLIMGVQEPDVITKRQQKVDELEKEADRIEKLYDALSEFDFGEYKTPLVAAQKADQGDAKAQELMEKYRDLNKQWLNSGTWGRISQLRGEATTERWFAEVPQRLVRTFNANGVKQVEVKKHDKTVSDEEIISTIGGPDRTTGSCSSLAFAYLANKAGYNVIDYRGGRSQIIFSDSDIIKDVARCFLDEGEGFWEGKGGVRNTQSLLKKMEPGKEYYLMSGRHAAAVRKNGGGYEYLELQNTSENNKWKPLTSERIKNRFKSDNTAYPAALIDVVRMANEPFFAKIMGYINNDGEQMKGEGGGMK